MSKNIKIVIGVVLVILAGLLLSQVSGHKTLKSGAAGSCTGAQTCFTSLYTSSSMTSGGGVIVSNALATSSTGSNTFAATDITNYSTILVTPNLSTGTYTLPTASALGTLYLPNVGDSTRVIIYNATTTGAAIMTLAGNTGSTLANASTSAKIAPGGAGILDVIRTGASTFLFVLTPVI